MTIDGDCSLKLVFYHGMARGNQCEAIFPGDEEHHIFPHSLEEACAIAGWRVHSWVLMDNLHHLMIPTPEAGLVAEMKWLQNACGGAGSMSDSPSGENLLEMDANPFSRREMAGLRRVSNAAPSRHERFSNKTQGGAGTCPRLWDGALSRLGLHPFRPDLYIRR